MDEQTLMQTIMRHESDIAQLKEMSETMTKSLSDIAVCVRKIAGKMDTMKGFIAGAAAAGAVISGSVIWVVKTIPAALFAAVK